MKNATWGPECQSDRPIRGVRRAGLTLLEVVVSMAIFLIALVALWHLMQVGSDRALDVKWQSMTSLKCQSKLTQVITGEIPLSSSGGYQPFDEPEPYDKLEWKIDADPGMAIGIYDVRVSVRTTMASGRVIESVLAQMVMDPKMRGSTQDRPDPADVPPAPTQTGTTGQ